jgi:cell division septation protein DedD
VLLAVLVPVVVGAQGVSGAALDSIVRRALRLSNEGNAAAGRALADSLFRLTGEGSDARAEALFLRATLAADTPTALRDYRAIVVEYTLSPRAPDALLRLGQAEYARGDRQAARQYLERLLLDHPKSATAADAWYWLARARTDDGDLAGGCVALDSARARLPEDAVERLNQISFAAQRCRALPAATDTSGKRAAPPASKAAGAADTAATRAAAPPAGRTTPPPSTARQWSAQVGAFKTRREAEALVGSLKGRGVEARVDSLALFHVRIGRFARRAEAAALVTRLKQQRIDAFVVEAPKREP